MDTKEKRLAVIEKFYGGKRSVGMHKFNENTGVCEYCRVFIGDAKTTLCQVITPEEVALFRSNDQNYDPDAGDR